MHKVVHIKSAQAFHLWRIHYSYTGWSLTNCRKIFLSGVLLMAQTWKKKFCCFLFKTSFLCTQTNLKEMKLESSMKLKRGCCQGGAQENLSLHGHFTEALSLAHIRIHPVPALYGGWSPQIRQHRCPICHTSILCLGTHRREQKAMANCLNTIKTWF